MKVEVRYEQAVETLTAIVQEYGEDFVYEKKRLQDTPTPAGLGCHYYWEGEPDCLIGKMLHRLGYREEDIPVSNSIGSLIRGGTVLVDRLRTHELLVTAQVTQDDGGTWGEALRRGLTESQRMPTWA